MHRSSLLALALLGSFFVAGAHAELSPGSNVHFTWDTCDNTTDNFVYTGQLTARQIVSVSNYSGTLSSFWVNISLAREQLGNPAWLCAIDWFDSQALASHFQPVTSGPCPGIPGMQISVAKTCLTPPCLNLVQVFVTVTPPVILDPGTRYALFEINYDLSGTSTTSNCAAGDLDDPQCFGQVGNTLTDVPFSAEPNWLLSSQATTGSADECALAVPARSSTWGRLKSIYR